MNLAVHEDHEPDPDGDNEPRREHDEYSSRINRTSELPNEVAGEDG